LITNFLLPRLRITGEKQEVTVRRELPLRPHLDQLKKQAKELLGAHKRRDPEALERIRTSLPSMASCSPSEIARAHFALHDAQSTIAREYGFHSWNELRAGVEKRNDSAALLDPSPSLDPVLGGLGRWQAHLQAAGVPDVRTALMDVARQIEDFAARRGEGVPVPPDVLPEALPVLAVRNEMLMPHSMARFQVGRSLRAIDAARNDRPSLLAVFAQRAEETRDVKADLLYPVGCLALLWMRMPTVLGNALVVVEGLQWISLLSLDHAADYARAHVSRMRVDTEANGDEIAPLTERLRHLSCLVAPRAQPHPQAVESIEGVNEPAKLADLTMTKLACSVADKARYASEVRLVDRLRIASALAERQVASGAA
jgi:hypothetical protein